LGRERLRTVASVVGQRRRHPRR